MRVLFTSTWGYGHALPMVPLARALQARGHEVRWATCGAAVDVARQSGFDVVQAGLEAAAIKALVERCTSHAATLPGPERAPWMFPHMFGLGATPAMTRDLLLLAAEWRPDLLVHEPAELASPLVAAVLGIRCVTHSWGGVVPAEIFVAAAALLDDLWSDHGQAVPPHAGVSEGLYLDLCPASVQPRPLDHFPHRLPLRAVEPAREQPEPPGWTGDLRPLVYLTLGTVFSAVPVLLAALAGLTAAGARVLVTLGPAGDPAALGVQPEGVHVERWVNQARVLPHVAAVVSHGGSGTFLGALAHGRPQLCLPQAADQFRNSEGLTRSGSGLTLSPDEATPRAVTDAVTRLLDESHFRAAAELVAEEMAAMPSAEAVARLLER